MHMIRWTSLAVLASLLAACADGSDQQTCYRIVESLVTEAGARALMAVPCPAGEQGLIGSSS